MCSETDSCQLRAARRDLVALSAVATGWVGREPQAIAAGLAEAVVDLLRLDFAFVRLSDPCGGISVEVARGNAGEAVPQWLHHHLTVNAGMTRPEIICDTDDAARAGRGIVIPIGVEAEGGLLAASCRRTDFPNDIDRLLLSAAVNPAISSFRAARLSTTTDVLRKQRA